MIDFVTDLQMMDEKHFCQTGLVSDSGETLSTDRDQNGKPENQDENVTEHTTDNAKKRLSVGDYH